MISYVLTSIKRNLRKHTIYTVCFSIIICEYFTICMLESFCGQLNNQLTEETGILITVASENQVYPRNTDREYSEHEYFNEMDKYLDMSCRIVETCKIDKHYTRISDRGLFLITFCNDEEKQLYTNGYFDMAIEEYREAFDDFIQKYEKETISEISKRQEYYFHINGLTIGCYSKDFIDSDIQIVEGKRWDSTDDAFTCLISDKRLYSLSSNYSTHKLNVGDFVYISPRVETENGVFCGDSVGFCIVGKFKTTIEKDTMTWPETEYDVIVSPEAFRELITQVDVMLTKKSQQQMIVQFPYYAFPISFSVNSIDQLRKVVSYIKEEYPEYGYYSNTEDYAVLLSITEAMRENYTLLKTLLQVVILIALFVLVYTGIQRNIRNIAIRSALGQNDTNIILQEICLTAVTIIVAVLLGYLLSKRIVLLTEDELVFSDYIDTELYRNYTVKQEQYSLIVENKDIVAFVTLIVSAFAFEIMSLKRVLTKNSTVKLLQGGAQ